MMTLVNGNFIGFLKKYFSPKNTFCRCVINIFKQISILFFIFHCNVVSNNLPFSQKSDNHQSREFFLLILGIQNSNNSYSVTEVSTSPTNTGTSTGSSTNTGTSTGSSTNSGTSTGSSTSTNISAESPACNSHPTDEHLLLGNPSCSSSSDNNNYLLLKSQYVVSYNNSKSIANWVSWHLQDTWLGSTPRQDDFREDPTLPIGFNVVQETHYSGSGFDRGHLSPSADRTDTVESNSSTFLMTNMIPQAPNNNRQTWAHLEDYERDLVAQGKELYVIAGGYNKGGTGSAGYLEVVNGYITVPERTWKVILVLDKGDNDISRINTLTRTIAVDMPNAQTINTSDWSIYRVSIDSIESKTGYDFFSNLDSSIQSQIESTVDSQIIP